jgi:uncharacterized NAD(P)/FAD-binding protein YdhS
VSRHVVVIGGGFSGALFAVQAARRELEVTLIERGPAAGLGLAYGAAHESHLLNVRAGNMSALAEEPDHFVRWLEARGHADAAALFAPRRLYGAYVQELLGGAVSDGGISVRRGEAVDVREGRDGVRIGLADGGTVEADAAVLATGNQPPHPPRGLDPALVTSGRFWSDPWAPGVADGLTADARVLILGTGLTMVDIALLLDANGFDGRIVAVSRRGLLPRAHAAGPPPGRRAAAPTTVGAALLREVRERAGRIGWRHAVDELRPFTQEMWRAAGVEAQRRFLRHLRPWWDVHRHRIAPEVHQRLQAMMASGRLEVAAGRIERFDASGGHVEVSLRRRGAAEAETLRCDRIINCTGPEGHLPSSREPLLRNLLDCGAIRPDPLGIGIDIDEAARVVAADGVASGRLFALGPPTRGCLWEIVAVPDIRVQAAALADRLAG